MYQVFASMIASPEEEQCKNVLKKQRAAHTASKRKLVFELEKNKK